MRDRTTLRELRYLIDRAGDYRSGGSMVIPAETVSRIANEAMDDRARVAELEAERDQFKAGARELGLMLQKLNEMALEITGVAVVWDGEIDWQGVWENVADLGADLAAARAVIARVNAALATHPRCDVHPDDDAVTCGWKRAVASVQWALDSGADRA